jgi:hypothetical protein
MRYSESLNRKKSTAMLCFFCCVFSVLYFSYAHTPGSFLVLDSIKSVSPFIHAGADANTSLQHLLHLVLNETSGPLGRKVAASSFAIQAFFQHSVPEFKLFNFALHLLCTLVVYLVSKKLSKDSLAALIIAGAWSTLPLHASTVSYLVQRMTQLSALSVLASVWLYAELRDCYVKEMSRQAALLGISIFVVLSLGIFSKENAVLALPLFAMLEFFYFQGARLTNGSRSPIELRLHKFAGSALLVMSLVGLVITILVISGVWWQEAFARRTFTVFERLLSQVVVVTDYVRSIIYSSPNFLSVFHDDFVAVKSLADVRLVMALLVWVLIIGFALIEFKRERRSLLVAILSFLLLHLMESTIVPLELYFEHRNYLPTAIAFIFMGLWVFEVSRALSPFWWRTLFVGPILIWFFLNIMRLLALGITWSSPVLFAEASIAGHPDSYRANLFVANELMRKGYLGEAIEYSNRAHLLTNNESELDLTFRNLMIQCLDPTVSDLKDLDSSVVKRSVPPLFGTDVTLEALRRMVGSPSCDEKIVTPFLDSLWERLSAEGFQVSVLGGQYVLFRLSLLEYDLERYSTAVPYMRSYQSQFGPDIEIAARLLNVFGRSHDQVSYCEQSQYVILNASQFDATPYQKDSLEKIKGYWEGVFDCHAK